MTDVKQLITEHLDIWLTAETEKKSGRGRSSGSNDTIYGVQKLRELILELAFLGKLVPNMNESFNLKDKIIDEQKQLVKVDTLKKTTAIEVLENSEFSYPLPNKWSLIRLADAGYNLGQKTPDSKFSYIDVSAINSIFGRVENPTILSAEEAPSRARKKVKFGTVIYSTIRPYLNNIAVIDQSFDHEPIASTAFAVIHPYKVINSHYLFYYLRCPLFVEYVESQQIGIAYPAINDKQFFSGLLPVPPIEEQHRIVEKVDELMQLCDQLEQQQTLSSDAHATLVDTLLKALTQSSDADEFQDNWQRIVANFDVLFTTEYSIEQLKQTVLQLAVMGKLVKQDPSGESVATLLKRIEKNKNERIKNKEIQKPKSIVVDDSLKFEVPKTWNKVLLNDIAFVTKLAGFEYTKYMKLEDSGQVPVIRAQNVKPFDLNESSLKYIDLETSKQLQRCALDRDALLMTFIGAGIGDVCIFNKKQRYHLAPNVAKIEPFADTDLKYLLIFLNSPIGRDEIFKSLKATAQPSISMTTIREIWLPLPSLDEQKRIVEKVNQLFSIIDQLQVLQNKLQKTKLHLADALVANAAD